MTQPVSPDTPSAPPRLPAGRAWLIGIAAMAAIVAFYCFSSRGFPLSEPDEARYGEIAREMLVTGDWITPHVNFVKYFEKPPLVYWGTAIAFAGLGINEVVARLPSLLAGLATIALTVWLAARAYGAPTALLTLPILGLGPLFGVLAQVLTLDMSLTFFMTLAMVATWFGWCATSMAGDGGGSSSRTWYRVAYAATAFAILVKGPVAAVLVGAVALLFLPLHGGWRAVRAALDWRGTLLVLLLVLPWFTLVSWRNPEFLRFFIVDQHIARFLWTNEHSQPIWFFLPVLPVALAPFSLLLLLDPPSLRPHLSPRVWAPATRFLAIWAAVIVVFFSLSTSKLLTYVLPAMPPLAVLVARAVDRGLARGRIAGLVRTGWGFLVAGLIMSLCGGVLPFVVHHWRIPVVAPRLIVGGLVLAATGWVVLRLAPRTHPFRALSALAVGWLMLFAVMMTGRGAANDYSALGLAARAALGPDDRLAMYNHFTEGIPFYSQHRVIMVGLVGELDFGRRQGDQSAYFWHLDDLRREWAGPGRLLLVINRWELAALSPPLDPPPIELASKDEKVLLANR